MPDARMVRRIHCFISRHGDLLPESLEVHKVLQTLNRRPHIEKRFDLEAVDYRHDTPAAVGERPQRVVDTYQMKADKVDIFICIFWRRMGTPVIEPETGERYDSGTCYEFVKAYEARRRTGLPHILLYRCTRPSPEPDDPAVQAFFDRFHGPDADFEGLYRTYESLDEFRELLDAHLEKIIHAHFVSLIRDRHDNYQPVSLPANHIVREEMLNEIKACLTTETPDIALVSALKVRRGPIGLHGMGGIGKTVLARALCEDEQVQAAFRDGILWATLGKEPNIGNLLRGWVQTLGGSIAEPAPSIDSLKESLATALTGKVCLLVLDDVWRTAHVKPFRVATGASRLLLTTRDEEIAHEFGAGVVQVPAMSRAEAVCLLVLWSGNSLADTADSLKERIVEQLERLPLAIKLAGSQLRTRDPEKWVREFDIRKLQSKRPVPDDPHRSIETTFELSLEDLDPEQRKLYFALAIFKEDERTPEAAVCRLWKELNGLDPDDTAELLNDLAARALLDLNREDRTIRIHDLLRYYMQVKLGEPGQREAHRTLLAAYRSDDGRPAVRDDGYIYDHLAFHLAAVQAHEELRSLFLDQDWMRCRVSEESGCLYEGYLADLEQAWAVGDRGIDRNEASLADCFRYALIRTGINSLSEVHAPGIVARALEVGLWDPARALGIAGRMSDPMEALDMAEAILKTGRLDPGQQARASERAFQAAMRIGHEKNRYIRLTHMVPLLSEDWSKKAVECIYRAALDIPPGRLRCRAMKAIAPHLQPSDRTEALDHALRAAMKIEDPPDRVYMLADLAPKLAEDPKRAALHHALDLALEIPDQWTRVRALTALTPQLGDEQGEIAFESARASAEKIPDAGNRFHALRCLVELSGGERKEKLLQDAFRAALAIETPYWRCEALTSLAQDLEGGPKETALREALQSAMKCEPPGPRARLLGSLAPHLGEDQIAKPLQDTLRLARETPERNQRAEALATLAPLFKDGREEEILEEALQSVKEIAETEPRLHTLESLLPRFGKGLREEALDVFFAALGNRPEDARSYVLSALAPNFGTSGLERVLHAVSQMADDSCRTRVLGAYAPYFDRKLLDQAVKTVGTIRDHRACADSLTALSAQASENLKMRVADRALQEIGEISNHYDQADALIGLIPRLQESQIPEALACVFRIRDEGSRSRALAALAPQLRGSMIGEALDETLVTTDEYAMSNSLESLAPRLSPALLERALGAASKIKESRARAQSLTALLPHVAEARKKTMLLQTLKAAADCVEFPPATFAALAPLLNREGLIEEALKTVMSIADDYMRVHQLAVLAPYGDELQFRKAVQGIMKTESPLYRFRALACLGEELAGDRKDAVLLDAFHAAAQIPEKETSCRMIVELAPRLSGNMLKAARKRAFETAMEITDVEAQAAELVSLLPHLEEPLRTRAVETAMDTASRHGRIDLLIDLAPYMDESSLEKLFHGIMDLTDEIRCADLLARLAPQLREWMLEEASARAAAFAGKNCATILKALAPHLQGPILVRAFRVALEIIDPFHRREALEALTPRFEGAQVQTLLQAAQSLTDFDSLAPVAGFLLPQQEPLQIRRLLGRLLQCSKNKARSELLRTVIPLFTRAGLSEKTIDLFAGHIMEICFQWRWI